MSDSVWTIKRGLSWSRTIELLNPDGTAFDLTGYSVQSQVRRTEDDPSALFDFGVTIDSPATLGRFALSLTPVETSSSSLVVGSYLYSIVLTSPSGVKDEISSGAVRIRNSVTQ